MSRHFSRSTWVRMLDLRNSWFSRHTPTSHIPGDVGSGRVGDHVSWTSAIPVMSEPLPDENLRFCAQQAGFYRGPMFDVGARPSGGTWRRC